MTNVSVHRFALAATLAVGSVALAPNIRAARAAASPTSIELTSTNLKIRTTTGVRLLLQIYVKGEQANQKFTGTTSFGFTLTKGAAEYVSPSESHNWSFDMPSSILSGNLKKGDMQANTAVAMRPFGEAKVSFTQTSRKPESCSSGSGAIVSGSLTAVLNLHTLSAAWGSVTSKGSSLTFPGPSQLVLYGNCQTKDPVQACQVGRTWESAQNVVNKNGVEVSDSRFSGAVFPSEHGKTVGILTADRAVYLTNPQGQRDDELVDVSALQKYDPAAGTIQIKSFHGPVPYFTGGGTMKADGSGNKEPPQACAGSNGTMAQVADTLYFSGWTNQAGSPMVAHMSWGGNISVPDLDEGRIDVYALTK
ncbi:MAG TPA: hypothetical protein VG815_07740 [Chloroflexota bacterium]|nr:hypothetical protein [Chloroflexota bacterium]